MSDASLLTYFVWLENYCLTVLNRTSVEMNQTSGRVRKPSFMTGLNKYINAHISTLQFIYNGFTDVIYSQMDLYTHNIIKF